MRLHRRQGPSAPRRPAAASEVSYFGRRRCAALALRAALCFEVRVTPACAGHELKHLHESARRYGRVLHDVPRDNKCQFQNDRVSLDELLDWWVVCVVGDWGKLSV